MAGEQLAYERVTAKAFRLGLQSPDLKDRPPIRARYASWSEEQVREEFERFKKSKLCVLRYCAKHGYDRGAWSKRLREVIPDEEWDPVVEHNWPAHHWYVKGRELEYKVKGQLEKVGFFATRTRRSLTCADVTGLRADVNVIVQCKRHGALPPDEWNALVDLARQTGAVPLLASYKTGRLRYFRLDEKKPPKGSGIRGRRQPMTPIDVTLEGIVEIGPPAVVPIFDPALLIATAAA
jgi:Holliday junction resolvase